MFKLLLILVFCSPLSLSQGQASAGNAGMSNILGALVAGGLGVYMQHEKSEQLEEREEHKTDREQAMLHTRMMLEQMHQQEIARKYELEQQKLMMLHSEREADRRMRMSDQQFGHQLALTKAQQENQMKMMAMQQGFNPYGNQSMMPGVHPGMPPPMAAPPPMMAGMPSGVHPGMPPMMPPHPSMAPVQPRSTISTVAHGAASAVSGLISGIFGH